MSASRTTAVDSPPRKKLGAILASLILVAAWSVILPAMIPFPPRFDTGPHRALGEVLAAEALKARNPSSRITLLVRDTSGFKAPASVAQRDGLERVLRKAGVKINTIHVLKIDPLRIVEVPSGDFFELLRKSAENDVLISLLGPPSLSDEQLAKLGNKRPHIIAVCAGPIPQQINLRRLFDQKLLDAAVISRPDASRLPSSSGGTEAEFGRMFKLITPANLAELQSLAGAQP